MRSPKHCFARISIRSPLLAQCFQTAHEPSAIHPKPASLGANRTGGGGGGAQGHHTCAGMALRVTLSRIAQFGAMPRAAGGPFQKIPAPKAHMPRAVALAESGHGGCPLGPYAGLLGGAWGGGPSLGTFGVPVSLRSKPLTNEPLGLWGSGLWLVAGGWWRGALLNRRKTGQPPVAMVPWVGVFWAWCVGVRRANMPEPGIWGAIPCVPPPAAPPHTHLFFSKFPKIPHTAHPQKITGERK